MTRKILGGGETTAPDPGTNTGSELIELYKNQVLPSYPNGWDAREPAVATFGRAVLYSANTLGAISGDAGVGWTEVSQSQTFLTTPDRPWRDQKLIYERTRGIYLWLLQTQHRPSPDGPNMYRLIVINGQKNLLSLADPGFTQVFWYDFDPQEYDDRTGYYWDYPALACSANYAWFATHYGQGNWEGSYVFRAPLDNLRDDEPVGHEPTIFEYFTDGYANITICNGLGNSTEMIIAQRRSPPTNKMLIRRWREADTAPQSVIERDIPGWGSGDPVAIGPEGDWITGVVRHMHAAAATSTHVYLFWGSAQYLDLPYPFEVVAIFRRSDMAYVGTEYIWSNDTAWGFASVDVNDAGHLAGTIAFGGGALHPGLAAWISDTPDASGVLHFSPLEYRVVRFGQHTQSSGRFGDYFSARRHVPYGNTWVGTGYTYQAGRTDSDSELSYVWFGRPANRPPTYHSIYVDKANLTGYETGVLGHPFNTVDEGHFATMPGDTVYIQAGTYDEPITLSRACTIRNRGGLVTIGP